MEILPAAATDVVEDVASNCASSTYISSGDSRSPVCGDRVVVEIAGQFCEGEVRDRNDSASRYVI